MRVGRRERGAPRLREDTGAPFAAGVVRPTDPTLVCADEVDVAGGSSDAYASGGRIVLGGVRSVSSTCATPRPRPAYPLSCPVAGARHVGPDATVPSRRPPLR